MSLEINAEFQDSTGDSECCVKFMQGTSGTIFMQGITPSQGYNLDHEISVKLQTVIQLSQSTNYTCRFFKNYGTSPLLLNVNIIISQYDISV